MRIRKGNYGQYSTANYGANTIWIEINNLTLYFSYNTIIAYEIHGYVVCSENNWSVTTGKHLNWIEPDKKKRLEHSEFEDKLQDILSRHNIIIHGV